MLCITSTFMVCYLSLTYSLRREKRLNILRVEFLEESESLVLGFQTKTKLPLFVLCETAVSECCPR